MHFYLLMALVISAESTPGEFAAELKRINDVQSQKTTKSNWKEVQREAHMQLRLLIEKAEGRDPTSLTPDDLQAVASAHAQIENWRGALLWADRAVEIDPKSAVGHETRIRSLIQLDRPDEAEKALKKSPPLESWVRLALHRRLADSFEARKDFQKASEHLTPVVMNERQNQKMRPSMGSDLAQATGRLIHFLSICDEHQKAGEELDKSLAVLRQTASRTPESWQSVTLLYVSAARSLRESGREAAAEKLLLAESAAVERAFVESSDRLRPIHLKRKVELMSGRIKDADTATATNLRNELAAMLVRDALSYRKEPKTANVSIKGLLDMVTRLVNVQPDAALETIKRTESLLADLGSDVSDAERMRVQKRLEYFARVATEAAARKPRS
jgi:tetratricopeptide (TPR) repeat protein